MNWNLLIQQESSKNYFKGIKDFIATERQTKSIYPGPTDIFNGLRMVPQNETHVIIIGADPYSTKETSDGIAFSTQKKETPAALSNIFKEVHSDHLEEYGVSFNIDHVFPSNSLKFWSRQGVVLLNSILTVEHNRALSHKGIGWENFTTEVVKTANEFERPTVFMLWGITAGAYKEQITNKKHLVLEAAHPTSGKGFFGCRHFSECNKFLAKTSPYKVGPHQINWATYF